MLLPDGPHAADEEAFLRAWEQDERERPLREERARKAAEEARALALTRREAVGATITAWVSRALTSHLWGEPIDAASEVGAAPDKCEESGCVRRFALPYEIVAPTGPEPRLATIEVRVALAEGRVTSLTIDAGDDGFVAWQEAAEGHVLDHDAPDVRVAARAFARNRVEAAANAASATGSPCVAIEAPMERQLTCSGGRVVIESRATASTITRDLVTVYPPP